MEKNAEQDLKNKSLIFFLKMKVFFPKSKKVYFLIYILKLIPLIVITHDWNITSKYSISFEQTDKYYEDKNPDDYLDEYYENFYK